MMTGGHFMQLEDYLEFEKLDRCDRIRVKGTRLPVELIIQEYLGGSLPEQIAGNYRRSVNLEQVFAVLAYYFHNKAEMDGYMERTRQFEADGYQEHLKQERPEVVKRLLELRSSQSPAQSS
jgi:uncharacterized protein (DUF433 family)